MKSYPKAAAGALLLLGAAAAAEAQTITLGQVDCLPLGGNGVLNASVTPEVPGATTRLYFRRLSDTIEDFYFVDMKSAGAGGYWATFPIPTDDEAAKQELKNYAYEGKVVPNSGKPWASWWRSKEGSIGRNPNGDLDSAEIQERAAVGKTQPRTWMASMDDASFQAWLDLQKAEPAEYYVAVVDSAGKQLAATPMRVVEVNKDCRVALTDEQQEFAEELTIGETAAWQEDDDNVFHWECDGIENRRGSDNAVRDNDSCAGFIIAWWTAPAVATAGAIGVVSVLNDDPIDVSPSIP